MAAITPDQVQAENDAYVRNIVGRPSDPDNLAKEDEIFANQHPGPTFWEKWTAPIGRVTTSLLDRAIGASDSINVMREHAAHDIGAGVATAVANTGDAIGSAVTSSGKGLAAAEDPAHADDAQEGSLPTSPIWDHAKGAILDFRDAVAVKDPTLADNLLQSGAQLAVPFTGYSRALAGVHGFAKIAAAGAITDATALGPHDPRMADLIALGRHVEGKLGDTLRALAPDGSAVNAYINYLGDRTNETEAEGRFKNVLDGFGANAILTPLLHAAASGLKWGTAGLRYAVGKGVGAASDMVPPKSAVVEGYQPQNMNLSPEERAAERERVAALRDREEGVGQEVVPEPIPKRAAETEGEAVRRDRADPNAVAAMAAPIGSSSMESDGAITAARTFLKAQNAAGHEGSLHAMVTTLGAHIDGSTTDGAFYKDILGRISAKNLDAKIVPPGTGLQSSVEEAGPSIAGRNNSVEGTVALYPAAFKDNRTLVHTIAHESVHAATVEAIDSQPAVKSALAQLLKEITPANRTVAQLGKQDQYGLTNEKEFVAEAESNPRFQKMLKSVKSTDGRPLWDHYKEVIGGIFGISGAALMAPQFDKLLTKGENGA